MDMDNMEMEKLRAVEVQKDLIHQLEDIRENAERVLARLTEAQGEKKLIPTDGTIYSLLGCLIMAAVKNETEYNVLAKRIVFGEQLQKMSKARRE